MAFFRAAWSASSVALARRLEDAAEVRRALTGVTAVTIDFTETSEANESLAARHAVDHVPTLVIFDDQGRVADRFEGEVDLAALVAALERVTR